MNSLHEIRWAAKASLAIAICIGPLALAIFLPIVPLVRADFDIGVQTAQLGVTLPFVAVLLAPLVSGLIVDRIGRRQVLVASLWLTATGAAITATTVDYDWFLLGRVLTGLASSVALVVARVVVHDLPGDDALSRRLAFYSVAPLLAVIGAPLIGAMITHWLHWRWVFGFLAIVGVIAGLLAARSLPETHVANPHNETLDTTMLLRSTTLWGYCLQSGLHFGVSIGFCATAAHMLVELLGEPVIEYAFGLVMLCVALGFGVLTAGVAGPSFSHRFFVTATSILAVFVSVGSYGVIAIYHWPLSFWTLFMPGLFLAFTAGVALPSSQAGILEAVPGQAGGAMGLATACQMLFAALFIHLMASDYQLGLDVFAFYVSLATILACLFCGLLFIKAAEVKK